VIESVKLPDGVTLEGEAREHRPALPNLKQKQVPRAALTRKAKRQKVRRRPICVPCPRRKAGVVFKHSLQLVLLLGDKRNG
jgi:hypothetical protein